MQRSEESNKALDVLKVLADDTRWALLRALRLSDYQAGELAEQLALPANLVSYHLGALRQAGLVHTHRSEADGRVLYYGLDRGALEAAYRQIGLDLQLAPASQPQGMLAELVVFLCTGNSARSQMAESWLRHLGQGRIAVRSAGTEPRPLHPMAVQAMAEVGIDMGYQQSKSVASLGEIHPQVVVTVCDRARETCSPGFDAPVQLHWSVADPVQSGSGDALGAFRQARDDLRVRVAGLMTALPELLAREK